ncbi:MAG TPA: hypothetical protein VLL54_14660 [Pyrinomonadaceae bacterium]|nr:hypothetical protein [Pyrinomonadaceae bacterium]
MRRVNATVLALMIAIVPLVQTAQAQSTSADDARTAKVKADVAKRLANKKTHVKIKLHDGSVVNGRLEQGNTDTFKVSEDKTGKTTELSYGAVDKVSGRNMSAMTKVGIGIAVAAGIAGILAIAVLRSLD